MKKEFETMNASVTPPEGLHRKVMERIEPKRGIRLRPIAAVAVMLALLLAATPVMAENVPLVHDTLYLVAPELADRLVPVQMEDSDTGITMEVVAASVHGNVAEWVIRIEGEELAEWDIVTPVLKIKDHCWFSGMTTSTSGESLNDYEGMAEDRENGIWYYSYKKTYPEGTTATEILGDKMTIKLSGVEVCKDSGEGIEAPVIFTDYELMTVVSERALKDYGFSGFGWYGDEREEYILMTPGERVYDVTDWLSLTGAAYIDGKLHIQTMGVDKGEWICWPPYFLNADGSKVIQVDCNSFTIEEDGHEIVYEETVYDIPEEELENYTMLIRLMELDAISSKCEVTFRIRDLEYTAE